MKDIIDLVVALTAVFSLIVVWFTLREMRIQRHKTFEPYLLPLNNEFVFLCQYPEVLLPINSYLNREQVINKLKCNISLQVKNIGQGIAKDISIVVKWEIRYSDYLEFIIVELKRQNIDIDIQLSQTSCWISYDESIGLLGGGNYPFQYETKINYDYLLPVKDNNEDIKIEIPNSVKLILELSILLIEILPNSEKEAIFEKLKNDFQVKIDILYKDNLEKKFLNYCDFKINNLGILMEGSFKGKMYKLKLERD
ncbi:hypothetical protein [Flavobacterium sp. YJ01]|uniref:hypothetical protein n=1 Tax=unclassified Flavobacterium TaxID=196869 RepID=UPI0023E352CE|nr:hypothetical protein [Flavobacterium sp. YJ01]WET00962.1 hypothetical protein P0R33_14395 [Flavobacterium sp. YJ01]